MQVLSRGIALTERCQYAAALRIFATVYKTIEPDKYPRGISSYGVCLARVERKSKLGAELCERAMLLEPQDALHRANLVRVYAAANNRRKAIEVLEKGLRRRTQDPTLLRVRNEIGYRSSPTLRFLRRTHPLNKLYSRCARVMVKPVTLTLVLSLLRLG
jgi:hypothetical protein